jgi:hypothetical protein
MKACGRPAVGQTQSAATTKTQNSHDRCASRRRCCSRREGAASASTDSAVGVAASGHHRHRPPPVRLSAWSPAIEEGAMRRSRAALGGRYGRRPALAGITGGLR